MKINRKVSSEEGAKFAIKEGYTFMETSCLENRNLEDSFETLIELTYENALERREESISEKLRLSIDKDNVPDPSISSGCSC